MEHLIELKDVYKIYQMGEETVHALDGVSLTIDQGEFVAIVGSSGSGKSTAMNIIGCLDVPTSGTYHLGGIDVSTMDDDQQAEIRNKMLGFIFQQYNLIPKLNVLENVELPLLYAGVDASERKERAMASLQRVGLADKCRNLPSQLSGGQQQRVALARAVVIEPSVLLFDEPLSNLDAKLRESMRDELRALQQRLGITSLYVTHDQSEAMAISDKVVIMKDGVICQQGTPQEIYEQPASRFVANFIGKANFIDGTFKGRDGEAALVEIGGKTFSIPAPGKMEGVEVGGACCLTVRPESFLLTKDAGALPGTVSRATYYGAKIEYEVMLNEQPIIVEVYNPQLTERFSVGDAVTMSLIEGCVRVLK